MTISLFQNSKSSLGIQNVSPHLPTQAGSSTQLKQHYGQKEVLQQRFNHKWKLINSNRWKNHLIWRPGYKWYNSHNPFNANYINNNDNDDDDAKFNAGSYKDIWVCWHAEAAHMQECEDAGGGEPKPNVLNCHRSVKQDQIRGPVPHATPSTSLAWPGTPEGDNNQPSGHDDDQRTASTTSKDKKDPAKKNQQLLNASQLCKEVQKDSQNHKCDCLGPCSWVQTRRCRCCDCIGQDRAACNCCTCKAAKFNQVGCGFHVCFNKEARNRNAENGWCLNIVVKISSSDFPNKDKKEYNDIMESADESFQNLLATNNINMDKGETTGSTHQQRTC